MKAARPAPALPMPLKTGAGLAVAGLAILLSGIAVAQGAGLLAAFYLFGAAAIAAPVLFFAAIALAMGTAEHLRNRRNAGSALERASTSLENTP